jgi:hypothetical protein
MSESTAMDAALAVALAAPLAGAPTGASESTAASPVPAGGKKNQKTDQDQKNAQFFMTILSNMTNRPKVNRSFSRQFSQVLSPYYLGPPSSINTI